MPAKSSKKTKALNLPPQFRPKSQEESSCDKIMVTYARQVGSNKIKSGYNGYNIGFVVKEHS